ncbi:DUF3977 family protein [Sutcliffiella rhizosphaerae]|uniref:DUF3977 family protein n=1 Tax=Sutcliffiella rhizosphaerae TaxID=2880967 RepID=A0ABM8YSY7_9BACI|nr:DUF3977 family protein [Sutcliffiella rhizosphaerae]CAG9623123.1 hypothetical protein BACCIP111883_03919 [Sutcliffiella rhizosphaerae]
MKYIEFGIGSSWLIRTETELDEGTEFEEKGIVGPIELQSLYIRIWIGSTVLLIDSKEGFKRMKKKRKELKLILGMVSK